MYPKWDDFEFSGVTARYWRFRILTTDDSNNLQMRELELYGHDCLGDSDALLLEYGVRVSPSAAVLGTLESMTAVVESNAVLAPGDLPLGGVTIEFASPGMCSVPAKITVLAQ